MFDIQPQAQTWSTTFCTLFVTFEPIKLEMTATPQNDHNDLKISNFSSKIIFLEILIQNTKKKFGNRKNDDYLVVETNTKNRQNSFNDILFDKEMLFRIRLFF